MHDRKLLGKHVWNRFARAMTRLGRHELALLVMSMCVVGAIWLFIELASEVVDGDIHEIDHRVLMSLRSEKDLSDPLGPQWFEELMRDMTALGSFGLIGFLTVASCGYLMLQRKYRAMLFVVAAVVGGLLLSRALKLGFDRPRPDLVPHTARVFTASFPSAHSMMSAVTYLTIGALLARIQPSLKMKAYFLLLAMLLTLVIGVSRVYLGVHWPSDVVAGWTIGSAWALLCWTVALWLQRHQGIEQDVREPTPPE